jgi:ribosomal protein L37AE/L43A
VAQFANGIPQLIQLNVFTAPLAKNFAMEVDRYKQPPACPSCGRPMHFARSVPRIGAQPELWTYECRVCGVMFTAAWEARGRRDMSKNFR